MGDDEKLRLLEWLGYVAAVMIGVGATKGDVEPLEYFNVLGLAFAVIVIVRLMVMNIRQRQQVQLFEESDDSGADEGPAGG